MDLPKSIVFVGLDLSLRSTGINFILADLRTTQQISTNFQLLLYDKYYKPIRNVVQNTYTLPTNVTNDDLLIDDVVGTFYQDDQVEITRRIAVAEKGIVNIVKNKVLQYQQSYDIQDIVISIEGFIMPQIQGAVQFRSLTALIMLQGAVRLRLLNELRIKNNINIKFNIESPTKLKQLFTGNGNATKFDMVESFIKNFDGEKLIDCESVGKINDLVDAFALNTAGFMKYFYPNLYNEYHGFGDEIKQQKKKAKIANRKSKNKPKVNKNQAIDFSQWLPTE